MADLNHFTDLSAVPAGTLRSILTDANARKTEIKAGRRSRPLDGKVLAMIFEKPRPGPACRSMSACASLAAKPSC